MRAALRSSTGAFIQNPSAPANTHNEHCSIRFIWQRGSCGAKGPGGGKGAGGRNQPMGSMSARRGLGFLTIPEKNFSLLNTNEARFIRQFSLADSPQLLINGAHTIGPLINQLQRLADIVLGAKVTEKTSAESHWRLKTKKTAKPSD